MCTVHKPDWGISCSRTVESSLLLVVLFLYCNTDFLSLLLSLQSLEKHIEKLEEEIEKMQVGLVSYSLLRIHPFIINVVALY